MAKQLFYEDIFRNLQEKNIRYLVIGGIAVNLYGVQRATADIDLILSMSDENLSNFIALTEELGLRPKEKNMRAFAFEHPDDPSVVIDVMIEDLLPFEAAYERKQIMQAGGVNVSTISLADLIKIKQASGREQDLADVEALEKFGERT
ncbi:MAG: nucleotidyltransferase [Candidatus Margulisbacteria bacterium]|nr:nucleotidyltransferase [Candidatus Margulisiibacteriota bacterium]